MPSGCVILALLMIGDVAATADVNRNETAAADTVLRRLFELGDQPSPESLRGVQTYYRSLPEAVRRDEMVAYAYAVVLIRHNRLREAAAVLDEATARGCEDTAIDRASVWLAMALEQHGKALKDTVALREYLAGNHELQTREAAAEFLGQVSGFLEGPGASKIRHADHRRWHESLNLGWSGPDRTTFDRARTGVIDNYRRLFVANQQLKRQTEQARADKLKHAQHDHDRRIHKVAEKQHELDDKAAKHIAEAKAKDDAIDGDQDEIEQTRDALLWKIVPLEQQRLALISQLLPQPVQQPRGSAATNFTAQQAASPRDVFFHNAQIERMLTPLVVQLILLEGQLMQLGDADLELEVERLRTDWNYGRDLQRLAEQKRQVDRHQRRIEYDGRRLQAISTGYSTRLRLAAAPLTQFTTYVPFPFERERTRLLERAKTGTKP